MYKELHGYRLTLNNIHFYNNEMGHEKSDRDINDILKAISRIEKQVDLIKEGKTEVGNTGVNRLDVIKEKSKLIRIIAKQM